MPIIWESEKKRTQGKEPGRIKRSYVGFKLWSLRKQLKKYCHGCPLFCQVQLETVSICNNDCPFCPVNINTGRREYHLMPMAIIKKILKELGQLNYSEVIELYSNNEPLIDHRLAQIIRLTKKYVPKAIIVICTNGKLLDFAKFKELIDSGLDVLNINNYNDDFVLNPSIKKFVDDFKNSKYFTSHNIVICMRYKNTILSTRGGFAPNKKTKSSCPDFCMWPFVQFCVNYKGDVFLCCADALWKKILGNVTQNSILDIWNNSAYKDVREKIINTGRNAVFPCSTCDVYGLTHIIRVAGDRFVGRAAEAKATINDL